MKIFAKVDDICAELKSPVALESPKKTEAENKTDIFPEGIRRWRTNPRRKTRQKKEKFSPKGSGGGDRITEEKRSGTVREKPPERRQQSPKSQDRKKREIFTERIWRRRPNHRSKTKRNSARKNPGEETATTTERFWRVVSSRRESILKT